LKGIARRYGLSKNHTNFLDRNQLNYLEDSPKVISKGDAEGGSRGERGASSHQLLSEAEAITKGEYQGGGDALQQKQPDSASSPWPTNDWAMTASGRYILPPSWSKTDGVGHRINRRSIKQTVSWRS
jgi:hypothetical protein